MDQIDLEKLSKKADEIATSEKAREVAVAAEKSAESDLFNVTIEKIKPALCALSSRILSRYAFSSGQGGCNPVTEKTYFEERGLELVDDTSGDSDETGSRGTYKGESLYLLSDGRLAIVAKSGNWSQWQGEWTTKNYELEVVDVAVAMRRFNFAECIAALAKSLDDRANGNSAKVTAAAKARAEKLRGLVALVK